METPFATSVPPGPSHRRRRRPARLPNEADRRGAAGRSRRADHDAAAARGAACWRLHKTGALAGPRSSDPSGTRGGRFCRSRAHPRATRHEALGRLDPDPGVERRLCAGGSRPRQRPAPGSSDDRGAGPRQFACRRADAARPARCGIAASNTRAGGFGSGGTRSRRARRARLAEAIERSGAKRAAHMAQSRRGRSRLVRRGRRLRFETIASRP